MCLPTQCRYDCHVPSNVLNVLSSPRLTKPTRPIGIHGLPLRDWDGAKVPSGGNGSYCPHGIMSFPTWHRPYLAMMDAGPEDSMFFDRVSR